MGPTPCGPFERAQKHSPAYSKSSSATDGSPKNRSSIAHFFRISSIKIKLISFVNPLLPPVPSLRLRAFTTRLISASLDFSSQPKHIANIHRITGEPIGLQILNQFRVGSGGSSAHLASVLVNSQSHRYWSAGERACWEMKNLNGT
ncbi:hypothetical protein PCASD_21212 [Puccinia coronata f. sp. avenae]|uniref:Uncharacterized protein n=1 Tax=Puccinia coronata f. sp. avenae TaxID=200324 RepID=A0A2N5SAH8_9BASI|nr:hypothetical protein PCASD_21212 [Puccinia coronata f. sp. avenae]